MGVETDRDTVTNTFHVSETTKASVYGLAAAVALLGLTVLGGWFARVPALIQLHPSLVPMQFNTALCFFLLGLALIGLVAQRFGFARVCAGSVFIVAGLTLAEYLTGFDFGIDQFFMQHYITTLTSHPGRMAQGTALDFVFAALAILLANTPRPRNVLLLLIAVFGATTFALGASALLGYLINLEPLIAWSGSTHMAVHTAIGHAALGAAISAWSTVIATPQKRDVYRWLGVISFAVVLVLSLLLANALVRAESDRQQRELETEARWVAERVKAEFNSRIDAISRMARRWNTAGGTAQRVWEADAYSYLQDMPGFQALEWLDAGGFVRWVVPMAGNEKVLDIAPNQDPSRQRALDNAKNMRQLTVIGPVKFIQGGTGLLIFEPVFARDASDGFIVGVLRVDLLIQRIVEHNPQGFQVDVVHSGNSIYKSNHVSREPTGINAQVPLQLGVDGIELRLAHGSVSAVQQRVVLPWFVLASGTVVASFVAAVFWLWGLSVQRAKQALAASVALHEREAKFREFFEFAPVGIVLHTSDGKLIQANRALYEMLGYSEQQLYHLGYWDITPREYEAQDSAQLEALRARGSYGPYEKEYLHRNGSRIAVLLHGVLVKDRDGRELVWSVVQDISERQRADRLKREFISTVSHELRTPLTSIRGSLGLIAGGVAGDVAPAIHEMVAVAYRNSDRLVALINDILDIEKIEQEQIPLKIRRVDLSQIVEQALTANHGYAYSLGVAIHLSQGAPGVVVDADPDRLMQVMANLLSNAAKFSPVDGVVDVAILQRKRRARVEVRDQGSGIPESFRSRIFTKFSQADSSDTRVRGGTGLGLAISKAIVERMNGLIGFDTSPQGTTFYFELDIAA